MSSAKYGALSPVGEDTTTTEASAAPVFAKKKRCNDVLFALAFLAHLGFIAYTWFTYEAADPDVDYMDRGVWKYVGVVTLVSLILSSLALVFMTTFSDELVEIGLAGSCIITAGVAGYAVYVWKIWMMAVGGVAFLAALIFTWLVWKRIPFAAANLKTALTAVRTNFGLILLAYSLEVVAFAWTVLWVDATGAQMSNLGDWKIVFLYLISFFWTHQVINNLQHTIVASVLGSWWYNPQDANSCWDDGLNKALCHSLTFSFGSICFGSLLAGIVQALKWTHRLFADQSNRCSKCLAATINCLLSCCQDLVEYFNKWCFTFVGIHGDSYLEGGRQVIALFKQRGWSSLIADGLADGVMLVMKLSISLLSGLTGWWLVKHDNDIFVGVGIEAEDDDVVGFCAGVLVGYVVASIMMELVSSAINAVIVCFAEAPAEFQRHHPALCEEMLEAWKKAYPDECADDFESVKTAV